MKTYCILSDTNYGLMVHIVNSGSKEKAEEIAIACGAWKDCCTEEIDTKTSGCVYQE